MLPGFSLATDVMKLNEYLGEISGHTDEFGEWLYWMSIMGQPSTTEPWGWQIDGHHLIINCFILGDQMVLTPNFMGSEPVVAESGRYAGTRVFREEEAAGFALMSALALSSAVGLRSVRSSPSMCSPDRHETISSSPTRVLRSMNSQQTSSSC